MLIIILGYLPILVTFIIHPPPNEIWFMIPLTFIFNTGFIFLFIKKEPLIEMKEKYHIRKYIKKVESYRSYWIAFLIACGTNLIFITIQMTSKFLLIFPILFGIMFLNGLIVDMFLPMEKLLSKKISNREFNRFVLCKLYPWSWYTWGYRKSPEIVIILTIILYSVIPFSFLHLLSKLPDSIGNLAFILSLIFLFLGWSFFSLVLGLYCKCKYIIKKKEIMTEIG